MKYETAGAFRTALEHRLRERSQSTGLALSRLRKIVVFERLLTRLIHTAPNRWVLKGGLALDFRLGDRARTTKDMDLARQGDVETALEDLLEAQSLDLGDHFVFRSERGESPAHDVEIAVRFRIEAELAGRRFETVLLDIGFSDPALWQPERIRPPALLDFAGLEPADIPVLPLEQHIAEKVHAYTRTYAGTRESSRVKDLVDIVLVAAFYELDGARLWTALQSSFDSRATHSLPNSLPHPPATWERSYAKLARELGIPQNLETAHSQAAEFLDPVLRDQVTGRWDPSQAAWSPPI